MKKILKGMVSLLLTFLMLFSFLEPFSEVSNAASTYNVNGVTLPLTGFEAGKDVYDTYNCFYFAKMVYEKLWPGKTFTNDYRTSDNILKDVPITDSARKATPANLKKYIMQCVPGSVLRISRTADYVSKKSDGDAGHSLIIVAHTDRNFTFYDSNSSGIGLKTVSYSTYANDYYLSGKLYIKNAYIKYIKAPSTDKKRTNEEIVFEYLTEEVGLNTAAAVGVMANIWQESGFDTTEEYTEKDGTKSYGICQWRAGRRTKMEKHCKSLGYKSSDLLGQLSYLKYELNNSYKKSTLTPLKAVANTLEGAKKVADIVCRKFEVPAQMDLRSKQRQAKAAEFWQKYSKATICETPKITTEGYEGGIKVKLSTATSGAEIYYTTDGTTPTVSSSKYTREFNITATATVKAIAVKSGMKNSSEVSSKLTVGSVAKPIITQSLTAEHINVSITTDTEDASVYYTLDGTEPTSKSNKYTGLIYLYEDTTVKAVAVKNGCTNSSVTTFTATGSVPGKPDAEVKDNILGIGDILNVTWDAVPGAEKYTVSPLDDSPKKIEVISTDKTAASFTMKEAGIYQIKVTAVNFIGETHSDNLEVTVKNDVTVKFCDDDGSVILEQQVKYNGSTSAPTAPSKVGHTFAMWTTDKENPLSDELTGIKKDITVYAQYSVNTYSVTYTYNGNKIHAENVGYMSSATPPDSKVTPPAGYKIAAWTVVSTSGGTDYTKVDGNMTLAPVLTWGNKDLPIALTISEAVYEEGKYKVSYNAANNFDENTNVRIIAVLKTSNDKIVETVFSDEILSPSEVFTDTIVIPATNGGTVIELYAVSYKDGKTGGIYSEMVSKNIEVKGAGEWSIWSGWSEDKITSTEDKQIEEKTQYRIRQTEYTTSEGKSLEGWTLLSETPVFENKSYGSWSGWSFDKATSSSAKEVQTRTVYYYFHYCNGNNGLAPSKAYSNGKYGPHEICSTKALTIDRTSSSTGYKIVDGEKDCGMGCKSYYYGGKKTQYRYRTVTTTAIYKFGRYAAWSDWTDDVLSAGENQEIETRTVYRWREWVENDTQVSITEDLSGNEHTVNGKIDNTTDLNGYTATVMVYKNINTDPTAAQLIYIGQTTIGNNNTYSFSFVPKETLSAETGDFIVSMGIEGTDSLINIDVIEAPAKKFTVTFCDKDGNQLGIKEVSEGDDAAAEGFGIPDYEGYEFTGWDKSIQNISQNITVKAVYSKNKYSVVFVDTANGKVVSFKTDCWYGDKLTVPEKPSAEGKEFVGWKEVKNSDNSEVYIDVDGNTVITGNMIIYSDYLDIEQTVTFLDINGNVLEVQKVAYGESAALPETCFSDSESSEEYEFLGWSNETNWWNVTEDVTVTPLTAFSKRAEVVTSTVEEGKYEAEVPITLESSTSEGKIFYTVDGSEPVISKGNNGEMTAGENTFEYEPEDGLCIWITEDTVVKAVCGAQGNMDSEISEFVYEVDKESISDIENTSVLCQQPEGYYQVGETSVSICMAIVNPYNLVISAYGYSIIDKATDVHYDYDASTNLADKALGRVFNVTPLQPGTEYTYYFWAMIDGELYLSEENSVTTLGSAVLPGDVDCDGEVSSADARLALRAAVGLETLTDKEFTAADVDKNNSISSSDARRILRCAVGLETL